MSHWMGVMEITITNLQKAGNIFFIYKKFLSIVFLVAADTHYKFIPV